MKTPFPWYSESRSGGGWFVKLGGEQHFLGKHPDDAPKPKKGRDGRWKPPAVTLDQFYRLMALRDTASKSDYTFETVCALFQEELGEKDPDLAKRYEQTLSPFCIFEYRGRNVGKLLVNAELEGVQSPAASPTSTPRLRSSAVVVSLMVHTLACSTVRCLRGSGADKPVK